MGEMDRLRTSLANERTLLAYIRTALTLLIFGAGAIKFFPDNPAALASGLIILVGGVLVLAWGINHFCRVSVMIRNQGEDNRPGTEA